MSFVNVFFVIMTSLHSYTFLFMFVRFNDVLGVGISLADLAMMCQRHHTSKCHSVDDLNRVSVTPWVSVGHRLAHDLF